MLSRKLPVFLHQFQRHVFVKCRKLSSVNVSQAESTKDPAPFFFNKTTQKLLKSLTGFDEEKVFSKRKEGEPLQTPLFKYMTEEELTEARQAALRRAKRNLQMPPVVKEWEDIDVVLSRDPAIQGYSDSKFVFTDISFGISNKDRLIVVRDVDGTLRKAEHDERKRVNQIYFPMKGRDQETPMMFEAEHLKNVLDRKEYLFILNRACLQFEPDDPDFHRVTKATYNAINETNSFNEIRSTRHYGPLVFHLVWYKDLDNLLLENLQNLNTKDAADVIRLYYYIHESKPLTLTSESDPFAELEFIRSYTQSHSHDKGKLENAINACKERLEINQNVAEGIKKAHGLE